ncbi:hypothetical protein GGP41_003144 [Bipolaris sorokiniana]|uniref:Methyltransferase domain-containing protein n=2 Tax=Cochliobolus sativus TaxID=45130 RepID=A0A8H5Z9W9_COCSA|nr:uncharacterized protein COCSADRAFT_92666 [Bipolaris sorokiniana ND90Pr]EMD62792.1 hypothetical protein COCSADRAFT_92666 [Bipolaris sorokiniana ND90Pr]KAF5845466.1 hypothetical protein GGP41_003144 [Bipolaris sorokiniana]
MSSAPTTQDQANSKDWSASQYLKFNNERTRPVYDLITQILPHISSLSPRIYDLGCGPGNSTRVLTSSFPGAHVTGMDSSPDMLRRANDEFRSDSANVDFVSGDVSDFAVEKHTDLVFSNAVFHWLRSGDRIPALQRLFTSLKPGAILAFQMPDNYHEPSHALMRVVATLPSQPWSKYFADAHVGDLSDTQRPDLDPIEPTAQFYNAFVENASLVNIWRTNYHHVLNDAPAIVEWVKGTGLLPYLNRIEDEGAKAAFLKEYERRLQGAYPKLADGKVILVYPRFFVLVVRK